MSLSEKDQKAIDEMQSRMAEEAELEKLKAEVSKKRIQVENRKYTNLLERDQQNDKEVQIARTTNFTQMSSEQVLKLQDENEAYLKAAKHNMVFINDTFKGYIPFFRRNLILIAAKTGKGKSTAVTNIIYQTIRQTNTVTGKKCRVLHITNEENAGDAYNKLTCLSKGWNYIDHASFTEEQVAVFRKAMPIWAERVTIVDNNYGGGRDITKSIEGIRAIFDDLIARQEFPDVITFDFFQYVTISKLNPLLQPRQVLEALSEILNTYKDILPCPIVVMSQLWPNSQDNDGDLENKIKGSKSIIVPSTLALELVTDIENHLTEWIIHKNRFNGATVGKTLKTGFDKGAMVKYDNAFIESVMKAKMLRQSHQMDLAAGLGEVFDKKEEPK